MAAALACALALSGCSSERYVCVSDGEWPVTEVFAVLPGGGISSGAFDYYPHNKPEWVRAVEVDGDRARLEYTQDWASLDSEGRRISGTHLEILELDRNERVLRVASRDLGSGDHAAPPWDDSYPCSPMPWLDHALLIVFGVAGGAA